MKNYSVRPAQLSDLEGVYTLVAQQNINDYGEAMLTKDDLRNVWQTRNLEAHTCLAFSNGKLEGYAELADSDSPSIYLAERRNIDLAYQLLTILERIALQQKVERVRLITRISEKNEPLLQLFASNGYSSSLSFQIMELNMDTEPELPQWPEGIVVRTFILGMDEQRTYQADEEAAQDKGYHAPLSFEAWGKRMGLESERFDPSLWFLAYERTEIVGAALNFLEPASHTGWVDHLSVRRPWRNKGIGKALLLHTFREFHKRGVRKVKLSVDSKSLTHAPKLYEQVGMRTVQKYHIYKKDLT